jgi:hypothetical protein
MSDVAARYDVTVFAEMLERLTDYLVPGAVLMLDVEGKMVGGRVRAHVVEVFDCANWDEPLIED